VFWINLPIVAAAIVCTALFVPESRAARARRVDPIGQLLVIVVLGSLVSAIIEAGRLGWTSPVIIGLLLIAVLAAVGILVYEPRRTDPLLELRLFRSVPFSSAILMAVFALCGFGAFLFVTTLYLQTIRGFSALTAGLCMLPVGALILVISPYTGRVVGVRGPVVPLAIAGTALAIGAALSLWIQPATPLPVVLAIYLFFGLFLGTVNPPITNSAVSGMPTSMAGLAASVASSARQTGTTLGVAVAGTIVGATASAGPQAFTTAEHRVWWPVLVLGLAILALAIVSSTRWAQSTVLTHSDS
jgi:predicted MFS family arabinose efflux permease